MELTTDRKSEEIKILAELTGLKVDADLRWSFVLALVERGMMDKKELETELAKDNTFTGQLSYQTCLAAFPDQAAKDEAFKSISVEDITNSQRESKLI